MNLKLDENLPASLVGVLSGIGHDVDTVAEEGITGADDDSVWAATQQAGRFLITQDLDFSDLRRFQPGTHKGVLLVRLRIPGADALAAAVEAAFRSEDVSSWSGCFVVLTEHKIRVRHPE